MNEQVVGRDSGLLVLRKTSVNLRIDRHESKFRHYRKNSCFMLCCGWPQTVKAPSVSGLFCLSTSVCRWAARDLRSAAGLRSV
jgi:hypothetical protein